VLETVDSAASCKKLVSWTYKHAVPTVCFITSNVKGAVNPRVDISGPYLRYFFGALFKVLLHCSQGRNEKSHKISRSEHMALQRRSKMRTNRNALSS
jgi:hypothetical protein